MVYIFTINIFVILFYFSILFFTILLHQQILENAGGFLVSVGIIHREITCGSDDYTLFSELMCIQIFMLGFNTMLQIVAGYR